MQIWKLKYSRPIWVNKWNKNNEFTYVYNNLVKVKSDARFAPKCFWVALQIKWVGEGVTYNYMYIVD